MILKTSESFVAGAGSVLVAMISFAIYAYPLWRASQFSEEAVLDEMYLLDISRPNRDVQGTSLLSELFLNDYWGRPLSGASSHKSWRPMTVMSLRFLSNQSESGIFQSISYLPPIFFHRVVNVVIHTAVSHMVGVLALRMFPTSNQWHAWTLQWMAALIFALHPAHVEAVANTANRPHILSLLFSLSTLDSSLLVLTLMWTCGLLCSETILFQLPAVILTSALIQWRKPGNQNISKLFQTSLPRVILWILLTLVYLASRYVWGSLDIPDGLLERAETPFVFLRGFERIRSFAYVISIHIGKSFGVDPLGFAHEYSFQCVAPLATWADPRIAAPVGLTVFIVRETWKLLQKRNWEGMVLWCIVVTWMATLFPITGFLKVGTFIADRMCVPSTIVISVFGAQHVAAKVYNRQTSKLAKIALLFLVSYFLFGFWAPRVMKRTHDWTRHRHLFRATRKTCPKSAKNLLQLSKLYSGNDPELLDLTESLYVRCLLSLAVHD